MTAAGDCRGKSGLHEVTVPGNARPGQPEGKRHRKETARSSDRARVKRWGKSPPRTWQQGRHGKPHREQCQIGASCGAGRGPWSGIPSARRFQPERPGLAARARRQRRAERNGHPTPDHGPGRTESGLQAIRACTTPREAGGNFYCPRHGRHVVFAAGQATGGRMVNKTGMFRNAARNAAAAAQTEAVEADDFVLHK